MIWLQAYGSQRAECGGLNENGPHRLEYHYWKCGLVRGSVSQGDTKGALRVSWSYSGKSSQILTKYNQLYTGEATN